LNKDQIRDKWERDQECHQDKEKCQKDFDFQPVIGILTQPTADAKRDVFDFDSYILEVNDNFIRWSGSRTVAIPFDIPQKELLDLLPQINGVLFTGGALQLVNEEGEQHPYYVTAKRIFHYSKFMKDVKDEDWPVIGIC
jgi:gamma-glutamyl-gamma-aminobutyrate hydrolase PuuD